MDYNYNTIQTIMIEDGISAIDIELLHCSKILHVKAYLLDKETRMTIDELSGYITSGDGSDDANSDVRKTCNFSLHSYDSAYDLGWYNRFWLNQLVRIDLGFEHLGKIYYYTKGIYVFDQCGYTYDGSTKDLSFQCSDLVSTIDGTHGGNIIGLCPYCENKIPLEKCEKHRGSIFPDTIKIEGCTLLNEKEGTYKGNDIKKTVEDLLKQNGITDYRVDTIGQVSCLQGYADNWKQLRMETGTTQEEADYSEEYGVDDLKNDHGSWHMIPYDLEFDKEATLWEILVKIRDLYPGYEMFFDKNGRFIFQLIPICQHDRDILDHTQFEGLIISENTDLDLTTVKNATYVYGQSIETDRYSEECSIISSKYIKDEKEIAVTAISPTFDLPFVYESNIVLGIIIPETTETQKNWVSYLTINNETYPLTERKAILGKDENGDATNLIKYENIKFSKFNTTDMYCFKWLQNQQIWVYVGMWQIEGYWENNDENSQFAIDKIGYRLQIKSGGEYDNITSSSLAKERARYENWLVSRLTDTITLETVIIPFLEVNQKIQYRKLSDGSIDSYIIKSLSYSFTEGTMTITMMKFYELDPFITCS